MDFLPRWQVDVYHKTCFAGVVMGPQSVSISRIDSSFPFERQFFQIYLSADQTSIRSVNQVFSPSQFLMKFDFCFAIENSEIVWNGYE